MFYGQPVEVISKYIDQRSCNGVFRQLNPQMREIYDTLTQQKCKIFKVFNSIHPGDILLPGAARELPYKWKYSIVGFSPLFNHNRESLREIIYNTYSIKTRLGHVNDSDTIDMLADIMINNNRLKCLDLSYSNINVSYANSLAKVLKNNNGLTALNLTDSSINSEVVAALAESLKNNNTILTTLILSDNKIGEAGAISLAGLLKNNNTLTSLNLCHNQLYDSGAISLAAALKDNIGLTTINLSNNRIGTPGAISLAEALKINNSLIELDLRDNGLYYIKDSFKDKNINIYL